MMSSRHLAALGQMSPIFNVCSFSKPMRLSRAVCHSQFVCLAEQSFKFTVFIGLTTNMINNTLLLHSSV